MSSRFPDDFFVAMQPHRRWVGERMQESEASRSLIFADFERRFEFAIGGRVALPGLLIGDAELPEVRRRARERTGGERIEQVARVAGPAHSGRLFVSPVI